MLWCVLQVFEFSLLQKEYTQWSRALLKHGLHRLWLERDTPVTHIGFSRQNAAHIFLHDAFMLCVIDQTLVSVRYRRRASATLLQTPLLSPRVALPRANGHVLQPDDLEEPPRGGEEQIRPRFQDLQELPGIISTSHRVNQTSRRWR